MGLFSCPQSGPCFIPVKLGPMRCASTYILLNVGTCILRSHILFSPVSERSCKMFEFLALYFSLVSTIGSHLGCAYPSVQPQCIVEWYPKNDRPLYGVLQRMTGPCETFHVDCSHGITMPLNIPGGLGFPGKVIQGCPDGKSSPHFLGILSGLWLTMTALVKKEHNFAVPCCLPDIKCGVNLAGRCMNRNKECTGGAWSRFVQTCSCPIAGNVQWDDNKTLSDERCPEGPWPCCEPNYATTGIDGEDAQMVASEGGFTVGETGGIMAAAGSDRAFNAQELYQPFSWDDLQRSEASFQFQPVPVKSE